MAVLKISFEGRLVIPRAIRKDLRLRPGQLVEVMAWEGRIELVPVRPLRSMRGFLKGIDPTIHREQR